MPGVHGDAEQHEYSVSMQLRVRDWDVADLRAEKTMEPRTLHVLRVTKARMSGPDFLATRLADLGKWAIDAKTSKRPRQLPGRNWYSISLDAVLNLESYARQHNIPGCYVLGDMYVITPAEVRDADPKGWQRYGADGKKYFLIPSGAGRAFDTVFGHVGDYDLQMAA